MGGARSAKCRRCGATAGAPAPPPVAPGAPAPSRSTPSAMPRPPRRGSGARQSGSAAFAAAYFSATAPRANRGVRSLSLPASSVGGCRRSAFAPRLQSPTLSAASAPYAALGRSKLRPCPLQSRPHPAFCPLCVRVARSPPSSPPQSLLQNGSVPPFCYATLGPLVRRGQTGQRTQKSRAKHPTP